MNRRLFIFVIILMSISLAGIILLQLFWIRNAISIREEQFNNSVNNVLNETVEKLETRENIIFLGNKISNYSDGRVTRVYNNKNRQIKEVVNTDSSGTSSISYSIQSDDDADVVVEVRNEEIPSQPEELVGYKYEFGLDSIERDISRLKANIDIDSIEDVFVKEVAYIYDNSDTIINGPEDGYFLVKRAKNLNRAFIKMAYEFQTSTWSIEDRIDEDALKKALAESIVENGLQIPFEYGVLSMDSTLNYPVSSGGFDTEDREMDYSVSLFSNELSDEANFLVLQFPGKNLQVVKSMAWILAGSLLLTLVILATFGMTIFMILRQKKLSDMKSDFINNMTHEFKTPIATISLATDSISNPKIISNEKEVKYYTEIIREENQRMNNQVENVLRMSLLDKHELEFNCIESDIHGLIKSAVSKIELLVKERKAGIIFNDEAKNPMIRLDPDHFSNAVLNLLDNALKYSEENPEINIKTADTENGIQISVTDNGLGMSKEVQAKIFDKFYRKSSGNIHNIKGFGLGLSYVKAIIDAFGGSISVQSEPGKGSTFIIDIPRK